MKIAIEIWGELHHPAIKGYPKMTMESQAFFSRDPGIQGFMTSHLDPNANRNASYLGKGAGVNIHKSE